MRSLVFALLMTCSFTFAQAPGPTSELQNYFSDGEKIKQLAYLQKLTLKGCSNPKSSAEMPEMGNVELPYRVEGLKKLVGERFSQSFDENPKIKEAFHADLDKILNDESCLKSGNDCRTRLVATTIYYYQNLRPDIPGCKGYQKQEPLSKGYNNACEIELKYRKSKLSYYGNGNGGMDARGVYTDQLTDELNNVTMKVVRDVLNVTLAPPVKKKPEVKSSQEFYICNPVQFGVIYGFPLRMNLYREYYSGLEPGQVVVEKKKEPEPCVEEKLSLYSEFVPLNFEEGRSTAGADQLEPVKKKIKDFIVSNPNMIITDISVTSSSSRTPFYTTVGSKKVIDPKSDERNLKLAEERALFAKLALDEIKSSSSDLSKVNFEVKHTLSGPAFEAKDLNNRFVTKMTPGYEEKVKVYFEENKELLEKEAVIKSSSELMDESRFSNLYQVKYKPFQGFRINISGYKKESLKCAEIKSGSSKQSGGQNSKAIGQ